MNGMKKPGTPGYPGSQCFPSFARCGPSPGFTNGTPVPLRPGPPGDSPVAGVRADPNSAPSGSDDPPPCKSNSTTMTPGTTGGPRHAATRKAGPRDPPGRDRPVD